MLGQRRRNIGQTLLIDDIFLNLPKLPQTTGKSCDGVTEKKRGAFLGINNKTCPICVLSFKRDRGLRTHIAKKHPKEANANCLRALISNEINNKNGEDEADGIKKDGELSSRTSFNKIM